MPSSIKNLPLILIIIDGFGIAPPSRGNAITEAKMPFYNFLIRNYQTFVLAAAGEAVGLPWGEPGNSEVGHQNLGAGKIVYQEVLKINKSIEDGSFFNHQALLGAISHCKKHNSSLHILGILSDGGIHGHQDHIYAALELAGIHALKRVYIHVILDGRDVPYNSGIEYIKQLEKIIKRIKHGSIATISGRFWAMDRDNHWERIEKVYKAMAKAESQDIFDNPIDAIKMSYEKKIYDEEFSPAVISQAEHNGTARVQPGDSIIFTNYRPDRAREIASAFVLKSFDKFQRTFISNLHFVGMSEYDPDLPIVSAFKKEPVEYPFARAISEAGLTQLRIAETEKYAHVTYFFNGGKDIVFPGQENIIVPSKGSASYADIPNMSAYEITEKVIESISARKHDVIIVNFANPDMVGHTGNLRATISALSIVDSSIKSIVNGCAAKNGISIITSDHGNAEEMVNWENGHIIKEHSANPVPCTFVGEQFKLVKERKKDFYLNELKISGVLSDVSPTLLSILGLKKPDEMTSMFLL